MKLSIKVDGNKDVVVIKIPSVTILTNVSLNINLEHWECVLMGSRDVSYHIDTIIHVLMYPDNCNYKTQTNKLYIVYVKFFTQK